MQGLSSCNLCLNLDTSPLADNSFMCVLIVLFPSFYASPCHACPVCSAPVQDYISYLYPQAKEVQKRMLHDAWPNLAPGASVSSSSSSTIPLTIPNPYHHLASSIDGWTGVDHESYICITVHWLDGRWRMCSALLDIMLASERHTGEQVNEWMLQTYGNNHISVCFCVLILLFQIHSQFLFLSIFVSVLLVNAVLPRLDLSAITHDHGPDISKLFHYPSFTVSCVLIMNWIIQ